VSNLQHSFPRDIVKRLVSWAHEEVLNEQGLLSCVQEHLDETLSSTKAHGTLSDIKGHKLLNLNQKIVDCILLFFS
jgi:hypothetical protein